MNLKTKKAFLKSVKNILVLNVAFSKSVLVLIKNACIIMRAVRTLFKIGAEKLAFFRDQKNYDPYSCRYGSLKHAWVGPKALYIQVASFVVLAAPSL